MTQHLGNAPQARPILRQTRPLLRSSILSRLAWTAALPRLRALYASL